MKPKSFLILVLIVAALVVGLAVWAFADPTTPPVETDPDWGNWLTWGLLGLLGLVLHIINKVMETGGRTVADFIVYVTRNSLSIIYALLCYIGIIALWVSEGIPVVGMVKGVLTGATIPLAYMSTSIFKTYVKERTKPLSRDEP